MKLPTSRKAKRMTTHNDGLKIGRIERDGVPVVRLACAQAECVLDGAMLETLIQQLALSRSALKPGVPARLSPTHGYFISFDPAWVTEPNLNIDGMVLLLRHGGFGWLGFAFERQRLVGLREALASVSATRKQNQQTRPPAAIN